MSPRPDVSEERTHQIIESAMTVFAKKGFNKTRMSDIADETGVSKGTLYLYFKSKDAIIRSILETIFGRELTQARKLKDLNQPPAEKINLLAQSMISDLKKMKPLLSLYFEFMALAMRQEVVRTVIQETFQEFTEIIENLIHQGIENGDFRSVNVKDAALAVGAILEGTLLLWVYDPTLVDFEKHVIAGINILLDGLKA